MEFDAFDTSKLEERTARAKESWGNTPQWAEFEEKNAGRDAHAQADAGKQLMRLFVPFGAMAADGADPACDAAQQQAAAIQAFITEHFYTCSNEIFAQLGQAYGAGGEFTDNIDATAGPGAAVFAARAIESYCGTGVTLGT